RQWGERHAFAPGEPHSTLVDRHGARVPELKPAGSDGTLLDADTTHVEYAVSTERAPAQQAVTD
ncbi:hypothetical protein ACIP10_28115, partial [Streptomyces galbus]